MSGRVGSGRVRSRQPLLSESQLATLAELGEERRAEVGDELLRVGDHSYPFIAILEGEVAILDAAGNEIVRHGASGFLGEMNLLTGQTVFLTAVVTQPLRYIAVERDALRPLLFEDGPLSDLLLSTFIARREALQRVRGRRRRDRRPALVGGDDADARVRPQQPAAVHVARPGTRRRGGAVAGLDAASLPLVRLPGGAELHGPSTGEVSRALGIGRELAPREEVDLLVVGGGPGGPRRRRLRRLRRASRRSSSRAPRSAGRPARRGGSRTTSASRPASRGTELTSRAVTQARKFDARTGDALPRARRSSPATARYVVRLEDDHEIAARAVLLATGAQYRRLPVERPRRLRGHERLLRGRAARGAALRRLARRRRRRRELGRAGRVWLARGGALVTLLHRRADLRETMSDYLVRDLERYGVAVRDRSEIAELHGDDGRLEAVTLDDRRAPPLSFLFLFLGAPPVHRVARRHGRARRGRLHPHRRRRGRRRPARDEPAAASSPPATSAPARRSAAPTAVGEGAMAVQFVHARMAELTGAGS